MWSELIKDGNERLIIFYVLLCRSIGFDSTQYGGNINVILWQDLYGNYVLIVSKINVIEKIMKNLPDPQQAQQTDGSGTQKFPHLICILFRFRSLFWVTSDLITFV